MPRANPKQESFAGGLLGRRMHGRDSLPKYQSGLSVCQNWIPTVQGPLVKRPGTRHVIEAKYHDSAVALVRFEFSTTQAYVLEFGELYMRVHRNNATVLETAQAISGSPTAASPVSITFGGAHGWTTGDTVFVTGSGMAELNGRFFSITVTGATTITLDGENGTGRSTGSGGTVARVFELTTPYAADDVARIKYDQSNDVLYLAHAGYAPRKLTRTSDTAWTLTTIEGDEPPFETENADETILVGAGAATGTAITLSATQGGSPYALFTDDMIGGFVRLRELFASEHPKWQAGDNFSTTLPGGAMVTGDRCYYQGRVYELAGIISSAAATGVEPPIHDSGEQPDRKWRWTYINNGYGYGKITAVGGSPHGSTCTVNVDDFGVEFPESVDTGGSGAATHRWAIGAWNGEYGYPRAVAFHEDRLCWAGTEHSPQAVWASESGDYENYAYEGENASGLYFQLNTRRQNTIEWLKSEKVLVIGTRGGEFTLRGEDPTKGLAKDNFKSTAESRYGSREGVGAISVDSITLFAQRAGKKIHELLYDFDSDRYFAPDLTELSEEILDGGVRGIEQQHEPYRLVWVWMDDGTLASCTYVREQQTAGWAEHVLSGTAAKVLSAATIPHPDGDQDQLWLAVERTINGSTRKHIEFLEKVWTATDDREDAVYLDACLTYDGAPATVISKLEHLEGETVGILADGSPVPQKVVSGGSITLDAAASVVQVGLPYEARARTMRMEYGAAAGTSQGKTKRFAKVVFRVALTAPGFWVGQGSFDHESVDMVELFHLEPGDAMDSPLDLLDGDTERISLPGGWSKDGWVSWKHIEPTPATVLAVYPMGETQEGG